MRGRSVLIRIRIRALGQGGIPESVLAGVTLLCALLAVRSWQISGERRALERLRITAQNTDALSAGTHIWYDYRDHRDFLKWTRRWASNGAGWHPADSIAQLLFYHVVGIELFGDGITDSSLADLQPLAHLSSVKIRDAPCITDGCIPAFSSMERLENLWLVDTCVTRNGASELERALPRCRITWERRRPKPSISEHIADRHSRELTGLRVVTMRGATIDDATLATSSNLSAIGSLTITEAPLVTDAGLEHLTAASNLKRLTLHGTAVTAEDVSKLQEARPDCKIQRLPPGPRSCRPRNPSFVEWILRVFDPASR